MQPDGFATKPGGIMELAPRMQPNSFATEPGGIMEVAM